MELTNKKVLVIGAARSGIGAAEFLVKKGVKVFLNDLKEFEEISAIVNPLKTSGVELILGSHADVGELRPDFLVVSPGVPLFNPCIQEAYRLNIPVLGEVELATRFCSAPIVAITGTNGKTTTTALTGQIFLDAQKPTIIGGNIGTPLISQLDSLRKDHIVVLEVSSFQLETIVNFKPRVAAILNITPDHIDRHGNMENYIDAKSNIFANQGKDDYLVLNYDDELVRKLADKTKSKVIYFSRKHRLESGVYLQGNQVILRWLEKEYFVCNIEDVYIKGNHNLENAMAAIASGYVMGVSLENIKETLMTFQGVSHRLEFVAEINGVKYINDSKGTNPDASIKAIEAYSEPIILIAGGKNKGSDFDEIADLIAQKVSAVILVGEAGPDIRKALDKVGYKNYLEAKDYDQAVEIAAQRAQKGEIVLLSPACASFDMFKNFEERGEYFKKLVLAIRR